MRSNLPSFDQLTICMNRLQPGQIDPTLNPTIVKTEEFLPEPAPCAYSSAENSPTSFDDNDIIKFGPIEVKRRKKPAPTLATGRRSKYETLSPEEEHKRDVRRARNRAAAERVRVNRLNVEQNLQDQIDVLEDEEQTLLVNVQMLQREKLSLETRILTHEKICSTMTVSNYPSIDLMSAFTSNNNNSTFQQINNIDDLHFDESLFDLSSPVQIQTPLPTMLPGDDIDDFFINS